MYLIRGRNIAWLLECTSSRMNLARVPTSREVTGLSRSLWSCWMLGRWNSIRHHYSLNGWTSCRKISWSLKAATFRFKLFQSLGKLTGTSEAALPICLSNYVIFSIIDFKQNYSNWRRVNATRHVERDFLVSSRGWKQITSSYDFFYYRVYDVSASPIKLKHFRVTDTLCGKFTRVNSPENDQWRGALMFYLICAWSNVWVNKRDVDD